MSYGFYKVLHFASILFLFISLGAQALFFLLSDKQKNPGIHKSLMISHGVSLLVAFVAGFGLIVKIGISGAWPGWVYGKIVVWVLLGGIVVFNKKANLPWIIKALIILALGAAGVILAVAKPF